ncbi:ABC transporter [Herbidospora sp. NEAU-GS84]|uniref:ABC transporter n=1 Tax=Herbidospora solisilvae TaxID=2696284 RepID=A0A7C9NLR7_9ACTN|nr:GTPase [Herbidospora solisilvae]NAS26498.1 ABC transporter [Herbidospora solisilvae]
MKLLRRRSHISLDDRLKALGAAADVAEGRIAREPVDHARAVVARAGARAGLSVDHTAVALAGATGSGKSSLFNVLAGGEVARVGVTRPTTSKAQGALWSPEGSGPLLDWLDVPTRHVVNSDDLAGLILLDLPDHDSIELSHRLEVDRLVAVVDQLVWVMDPQKYADAAIHERYLRPLARHADVTLVVLNQIDRLPPEAVRRCIDDLRRLLAEDGLRDVPILPVSTVTGEGVQELKDLLTELVTRRHAWSSRLEADTAGAADHLIAASGGLPKSDLRVPDHDALDEALAEAAGVPLVVRAVAKAHRHHAVAAMGWPVTRWLRRFRPDPLRRLHLQRPTTGRTSLPQASAVQTSQMDSAVRAVGLEAAEGVPEPWAAAIRRSAREHHDDLADALDRAVAGSALGMERRPLWWRAVNALQWLLFATLLAGLGWLLVLYVLGFLQLPSLYTPTAGEVPWPTTLLVGAAVAGVVVALLTRGLAWIGSRRKARKSARVLRQNISDVADRLVITPIEHEQTRYTTFVKRARTASS